MKINDQKLKIAFWSNVDTKTTTVGNSCVKHVDDTTYLILHGSTIATRTKGGKLVINLHGYRTGTTIRRLCNVVGIDIRICKGEVLLYGNSISIDEDIVINKYS